MASLSSLPQIIKPRKTSLDLERDFEKYQAISISKAINTVESPVKAKHVRRIIIGTFQEKSARTFWNCVLRLPIQDNRIAAWKFCHVLHKILRDGHPNTIVSSLKHKTILNDLGRLWMHLRESYGKLIQLYCQLLITKLDFHKKNPRFPGNLSVTEDELEVIGENDINIYFQLSVEMFDYMDEILALQSAVFGSLDLSKATSMTTCGQCRLAPLIPCLQDAAKLYDFSVKILYKLHSALPADTLDGHRKRFLKQFRELAQFYRTSSTRQYFHNLITIPHLPDNPPNFLIQAELRSYVTPVVIVPEEQAESEPDGTAEGTLIDTSDIDSVAGASTVQTIDLLGRNGSISPTESSADALAEKDNIIEFLQQEIGQLRVDNQIALNEYKARTEHLAEKVTHLETELATKESELVQERQMKEDVFNQATQSLQNHDCEQKSKEEKFNRVVELYKQLREEHVQLLRQSADVDRQFKKTMQIKETLEQENQNLQSKLNKQISLDKNEFENAKEQIENLKKEMQLLHQQNDFYQSENKNLHETVKWMTNQSELIETETKKIKQEKEDLDVRLKKLHEQLQTIQTNLNEEKYNSAKQLNQSHLNVISSCEAILKHTQHELDNPALSALTCNPDYLKSLLPTTNQNLIDLKNSLDHILQLISTNNLVLINNGTNNFAAATCAIKQDNEIFLMTDLIKILTSKNNECNVSKRKTNEYETIDKINQLLIETTNHLSILLIHGKATSNIATNILFGEQMVDECKKLCQHVCDLYESMRNSSTNIEKYHQASITSLNNLSKLIDTLSSQLKGDSVEILGDLFEHELIDMEKAIEAAAKKIEDMLDKSRKDDSGVKLEVNEKILDSCTVLMRAIRILVQKSRLLQNEIVAEGKGSASVKEFYKRNHKWTEGLISAAKSVASGAKFLLSAADQVVSGQGKFEQLVVGAQEIAASTAQLVVASRVKASRGSANLAALGDASRAVTTSTGTVVATAKSCSKLVEENDELDTSGVSLHAAKRLEMEAQVKVLELEQSLQRERLRLASLRRHHYQLAGEIEGWDLIEKET